MAFQKYNSANNASALLDLPITESSNTLTLKGAFATFPTSNFIVTVTQYSWTTVLFRENMRISTRVWNICNIQTREFEPVPENDSAIVSIQESFAFASDSVVQVVNSSAFNKDMQDEIEQVRIDLWNDINTAVQRQNVVYGASSTGNDSYAITLSPVPASYTAGMTLRFLADVANTGVATLNANGLWAKTIKKTNDQDLASGDIEANQIVEVVYNATDDVWEMTSQIATLPTVYIDGLPAFTVPATGDKFIAYDVSSGANGAITYGDLKTAIKGEIIDKIQFHFSCSSTTRSTNTSSNVTITADAGGITMTPDWAQWYWKMLFEIKEFIFSIFSRVSFSMIVEWYNRNSIDSIFVWAWNLTMTWGVPTYLDSHVWFEVYYQAGVGTNIYATVANGTTRTKSATMLLIPKATPPQVISFYYKYITSADIEFWISADGGWTWTTTNITTNIPSASLAVNTLQYSNWNENTNITISKLLNLNYFA